MKKKYEPNGLFASLPEEKENELSDKSNASSKKSSERRLYTEQPVYVQSYSLLKQLIVVFRRMPRDIRFTIGKRMLDVMMDEVTSVFHAFKHVKERLSYIQQAQKQISEVQLYLRLLNDLAVISNRQYLYTLPLTSEIAIQLRAWYDYTYRRQS